MKRIWLLLAVAIAVAPAVAAWAQEGTAGEVTAPAHALPAGEELSIEQGRLADRYERLEQVLGQLAELSAGTDPNRARLLRAAIAKGREEDIQSRFESIVTLLEAERLSAATNNQTELRDELDALLDLLLKADRDKELESERDRIRKYLKEVGRLIRLQKGVRARTEGDDEPRRLAGDQQQVADDTGKLCENIAASEQKANGQNQTPKPKEGENAEKEPGDEQPNESKSPQDTEPPPNDGSSKPSEQSQSSEAQPTEGEPSQSQPGSQSQNEKSDSPPEQEQAPTDRAAERLKRAQQQMQEAHKKLEEAERAGAAEKQREAVAQLERAKAELERVLRQLREEEMERMLTQLAARFRKMLEMQTAVYEGTQRLDRIPAAERLRDEEIEAARLSRQESEIVREADKAMVLLREEGSSVAFPEAIEQMRDDMQQVVERLAAVKTDEITQGLEEDIIAALEETIAALEKAIKDLEKSRTPPGQPPAAGQPSEPPLVDKFAELKMIRALQVRINQRTQRYAKIIANEAESASDLLQAMQELAERQERVYKATHDLSQGLND